MKNFCILLLGLQFILYLFSNSLLVSAFHGSGIDARVNVFQVPDTIKQMNILVIYRFTGDSILAHEL
jgi:hypothetical protein